MSRLGSYGARLYRGEVSYDFVGKRRRWYLISTMISIVALIALFFPGLNFSIEFSGGAVYTVKPPTGISEQQIREKVEKVSGVGAATVQAQSDGRLRIQVGELSSQESQQLQQTLATGLDIPAGDINAQVIGPTWGEEISKKAGTGLVVFLVLVVLYLSVAFEWRMALAALIALIHDILITVGVYALVGFEVSPATVTGLLTILGYSLYDTVVVFDKVRENTGRLNASSRMTYSEAANLAVNQTLVRSINTSVVALLPVTAMLLIGVGFMGAGALNDLALALFIGLAAGTYSSIFIATPLLAQLKEEQPQMKALARRVAQRRAAEAKAAEGAPGAEAGAEGDASEPTDDVPASMVGERRQPVGRGRGRGRPSGKRH